MPVSRIIFWQPFASPHQEAFLEAVAEQFPGEVILGVERDLPPERVAQGWQRPNHKKVRVVDISVLKNHAWLANYRDADSLHVFTGFFSHPLVWSGFRKLASSEAKLAIYSEAPEQPLLTGWIKLLRGRLLARRWESRFEFVLAIGGVGCQFFQAIGFPNEKTVPFGYYLNVPPLSADRPVREDDGVVRFISAGQLIYRKGIDLLIKACASLPASGWRLDIYGDGPDRRSLDRLTARLRFGSRITFHGSVTNIIVQQALAMADCAVLPSRFDGWGALVNESLACGTPVICSSKCGAASLIETAECGAVFPSCSIAMLGERLREAAQAAQVSRERRKHVHAVAASRMSGQAAAAFFREVITHG